jgi:hypothetical protein
MASLGSTLPVHATKEAPAHDALALYLSEQLPVLDLERLPYLGRKVDRVPNQLSLPTHLQIDILLVVLALDMRDVDGDQDVRLLLLQPHQR